MRGGILEIVAIILFALIMLLIGMGVVAYVYQTDLAGCSATSSKKVLPQNKSQ